MLKLIPLMKIVLVRYTSDVRLLLHNKDLASRAGVSVASKFGTK